MRLFLRLFFWVECVQLLPLILSFGTAMTGPAVPRWQVLILFLLLQGLSAMLGLWLSIRQTVPVSREKAYVVLIVCQVLLGMLTWVAGVYTDYYAALLYRIVVAGILIKAGGE